MKILVTGSGGQLGSELQELAAVNEHIEFDFTDYPKLDLTKPEMVAAAFEKKDYDYCINCAAYTAVDKAEKDKAIADAINIDACKTLAYQCEKKNVALIHVSTDFVFNGTAHRPLREETPPSPVNHYGFSKLNGEKAIQEIAKKFFILRTSWLYSTYGNNFVKTMIRLSETKDELDVIADQIGTPTYARDLAKAILITIKTESKNYGLYHYSNEGAASWYDFTCAIFEYKGISTLVNPILTEQYPSPASRPYYSLMDKSKFKRTFGVKIPYWRKSLKECLEKL